MDTIASSEFRKHYSALTYPTVVTVNGHAIGSWFPAGYVTQGEIAIGKDIETFPLRVHYEQEPSVIAVQAATRVVRDPAFGHSRPAPKPSKHR